MSTASTDHLQPRGHLPAVGVVSTAVGIGGDVVVGGGRVGDIDSDVVVDGVVGVGGVDSVVVVDGVVVVGGVDSVVGGVMSKVCRLENTSSGN